MPNYRMRRKVQIELHVLWLVVQGQESVSWSQEPPILEKNRMSSLNVEKDLSIYIYYIYTL